MRKAAVTFILLCVSAIALAQQSYSVKQGDTLEDIAKEYRTTVKAIEKLNPNVDQLFPGLLLTIPPSDATETDEMQKGEKTDRINMRDGSYILCNVRTIRKGIINIKQDGIEAPLTVAVRDVTLIEYANGTKKRFRK